jgi:DNA-binding NarL/FixJ family response regulator
VAKRRGEGKAPRSYRPVVEDLETLRLPSEAARLLPGLVVERDPSGPASPVGMSPPAGPDASATAAVEDEPARSVNAARDGIEDDSIAAGLAQLGRYLSRAWSRAGVAVQQHDDCSQEVYAALLRILARAHFDRMVGTVGRRGVRQVLNRDSSLGPDFFRAIDAVKKRARRERRFQPLEASDVAAAARDDATRAGWRGALQEAIGRSLSRREASLIHATLEGETPAEIASRWDVAPKTISNAKTRVIQKLRDVLVAGPAA